MPGECIFALHHSIPAGGSTVCIQCTGTPSPLPYLECGCPGQEAEVQYIIMYCVRGDRWFGMVVSLY